MGQKLISFAFNLGQFDALIAGRVVFDCEPLVLNFNERVTGVCDYVTINNKGEVRSVYRPVDYKHPITGQHIKIKNLPQSDTEHAEDCITVWAAPSI